MFSEDFSLGQPSCTQLSTFFFGHRLNLFAFRIHSGPPPYILVLSLKYGFLARKIDGQNTQWMCNRVYYTNILTAVLHKNPVTNEVLHHECPLGAGKRSGSDISNLGRQSAAHFGGKQIEPMTKEKGGQLSAGQLS
ncbi:hypothetical protein DFH08DRAFT_820221 [Mycena albidolilacea]|uniref:Uncharacterized protein n=1 Tax=Mycena albidolilacea TaxID=1033008 RepID=A0AAD7EEJ6_9AGAR|nr:hypothetical protein DFH08DRAFT_820221 [Mycena albidolilacea]